MPVQYLIHIPDDLPSSDEKNVSWISTSSLRSYDQLFEIYSNNIREYQYDRCNPLMFKDWIGWHWNENESLILILSNENGYVVISEADGKGCDVSISEWRASNGDTETILLKSAAIEIRRRYRRKNFLLHTLPQYITLESLHWNTNIFERNEDLMIRNIRLDDRRFQDIQRSYQSQDRNSTIWPGEYY